MAWWWIETFTIVGSEPVFDKPVREAPEYIRFYVDCYALGKDGHRRFNHVFLSRPKGCDKSGKAARLALFEALGPCRFAGWAKGGETYTFLGQTYTYAKGEPMGRPISGPNIVCLATAEDQSGNVYDVIKYNCEHGPLAQLRGYGLDVGNTRILLPEGGSIKPGNSNSSSSDGGKQTFVVCDESHLWNVPRLKNSYYTYKRNLAKRYGDADPWVLETTTMYRPGEGSIAELTYRTAQDILAGRTKRDQHLLFDHRYSALGVEDLHDVDKLKHGLYEAYGSAAKPPERWPGVRKPLTYDWIFEPDGTMAPVDTHGLSEHGYKLSDPGVQPGPSKDGWVDIRGQIADILDPASDVGNSVRYYLNSLTSVSDAWLADSLIRKHTSYEYLFTENAGEDLNQLALWRHVIDEDDAITLGFDGSLSDDATALVGCRIRDGLLFLIRLEQKPDGPEAADWRVNVDAFDRAARFMLDNYNVKAFFADVAYWRDVIIGWENDYANLDLVPMHTNGEPIKFHTNTWRADMMQSLMDMHTAFSKEWEPSDDDDEPVVGDVELMADPRLLAHFRNARRKDFKQSNPDGSPKYLIYKETPNSPLKIDACMAGLLAYTARTRVLESRPKHRPRRTHISRVY
nr:hypothetical protein [Bifidobacterium sp. DSM 109957]